jgi:hypothetical protein
MLIDIYIQKSQQINRQQSEDQYITSVVTYLTIELLPSIRKKKEQQVVRKATLYRQAEPKLELRFSQR